MELNRKAILDKTHYGLTIYSYVLRNFYQTAKTVLSLSGRDCKPTKNPFNDNKKTLLISIVDNCAQHSDSENGIPKGDAFDFAKLYFKKQGSELFQILNEKLFLHIGEPKNLFVRKDIKSAEANPSDPGNNNLKISKIGIPECSFFKRPVSNIIPSKSVNLKELYVLIKGEVYKEMTSKLRSLTDIKIARAFKAKAFDYVCFSGTFKKRNDKALIKHSGLLAIDFDHISNIDSLKNKLLQDEYFETELLFISPSGDGLKWIIPIDLSKVRHQEFFKAVSNYILQTYDLEIDRSGKDISRACFIPHDENVYINPKYL